MSGEMYNVQQCREITFCVCSALEGNHLQIGVLMRSKGIVKNLCRVRSSDCMTRGRRHYKNMSTIKGTVLSECSFVK